jgi:hypothetical protein
MASTFKIYDGQNWIDPCNCNVNVRTSSNAWKLVDPKNCLVKYWTGTEWCQIVCPNPEQIVCGQGLSVSANSGVFYIPFTIPASAKGIKVHVDSGSARDAFQIVAADKTTWLAGLGNIGRSEIAQNASVNIGPALIQNTFVEGSMGPPAYINQSNGNGGFIFQTDTPANVVHNISGNWHTLEKLAPGVNSNYPNGGIIVHQFVPYPNQECTSTYNRTLVNRYIIPKTFIDTATTENRVHFTSEILPNQAPNTPFGGIILTEFSVGFAQTYSQPINRYYIPNNLNYSTNLAGYRIQNLTETFFGDVDRRSDPQTDPNGNIIGTNNRALMLYEKTTQQSEDVFIRVTGGVCGGTTWYIPRVECFYDDYIEPPLQAAQLYVT